MFYEFLQFVGFVADHYNTITHHQTKYWTKFFSGYGYKEQQQADIAKVMVQFL